MRDGRPHSICYRGTCFQPSMISIEDQEDGEVMLLLFGGGYS